MTTSRSIQLGLFITCAWLPSGLVHAEPAGYLLTGGKSPYLGTPEYPGTSEDHINLLVDYLYDAGLSNARWPLPKIIVEEDEGGFDDEILDDEDFDD